MPVTTHAQVAWQTDRAVELMRKGRTYDQIAHEVGYANRGTAHRVVAKALDQRIADNIDELREWESSRLDALQAALWPRVLKGEVRAVNSVLRIIDRRCRLYGLCAADQQQAVQMLVMPPEVGNTEQATEVAHEPACDDHASHELRAV